VLERNPTEIEGREEGRRREEGGRGKEEGKREEEAGGRRGRFSGLSSVSV
jgi:hypothetical protein